jgi:hypothetical protein
MQRAKAKHRAVQKVEKRKKLKQQKILEDDEMIVEEHLTDEIGYS